MKNIKAIDILSTLTKSEIKLLQKFIYSPLYVTRDNVRNLCLFCLKFYPTFEHDNFTLEEAHKYLYPDGVFKKSVIVKLSSELFKALESFIVYLKVNSDDKRKNILTLQWYNDRGINNLFNKKSVEIEKKLYSNESYKDKQSYFYQYEFEAEKSIAQSKKDKRVGDVNLQKYFDQLDIFFLVQKLSGLCLMINRERITQVVYEKDLMPELLIYLENSKYKKHPLIECYYHALAIIAKPGSRINYEVLKEKVVLNSERIPQIYLRQFYVYLENECLSIFKSPDELYKEVFSLYKGQIDSGSIYYKDKILSNVLKNIIIVSIKSNNLEWAETFLEEHKNKIIPKSNESNMYNYCNAEIAFVRNEYDKVLGFLNQVQINDVYLTLSVKRLYIKTWYETKNWDVLDAQINAFRVFMHRNNNIDTNRKQQERNFISIVSSLMKSLIEYDSKIEEKEKEIFLSKSTTDKKWIIEKISEF